MLHLSCSVLLGRTRLCVIRHLPPLSIGSMLLLQLCQLALHAGELCSCGLQLVMRRPAGKADQASGAAGLHCSSRPCNPAGVRSAAHLNSLAAST